MKNQTCLVIFLLLLAPVLYGQENVKVSEIPQNLISNANAVLRNEEISIEIEAVDKMNVHIKRSVTILNEYGEIHAGAYQFFDTDRKIKNQQAIIYNAEGKEIKKFKQKDFKERSAVASGTLYSDDRVQYLDYTAQGYPYTIVYESELQTGTTVFIRPWQPVSGYFLSVQKSTYNFKNKPGIPFRLEETNLENIHKNSWDDGFSYTITNVPAYKREYLSPSFEKFVPNLRVALNEFSLVGVKGKAANWQEFGKWQYDYLLAGKDKLPEHTLKKIGTLLEGVTTDLEKAKLIYQYVQDNTRYISVQLGIGGWSPMLPVDVDRLGYGDCKALTNYTKALLDSQEITSHYAVVFGGEERKDLDANFATMQGNHVILNIPQEEEDIWLECTSKTTPFNYLGDFTDNRNVLLIKPDGGEIVKTKAYAFSENLMETHTKIVLEESGDFNATVKRTSGGIPYGNIYHLMSQTRNDQILHYKERWPHLQELDFQTITFENNRQDQKFTELVQFKGKKLTSRLANGFLLGVNFISVATHEVPRINDRKLPFEIERGHSYKDTFEFHLPKGYMAESIPKEENIETEFGIYVVRVKAGEKEGVRTIEVSREYILYEGEWKADKYSDFRDFIKKIDSLNNQKTILVALT
ncbi:DUF3857 domain-containing protein [Antarcticibacterium arcticum]|uniref:DUF3857 domain-containing protein n=1 Tax=Antarcticibacterium arcticum TaxID=2585771 RepID=UPI00143D4FAA|nr:DUF3857 domain-containing protein [Antarcticibacterium arcticum]